MFTEEVLVPERRSGEVAETRPFLLHIIFSKLFTISFRYALEFTGLIYSTRKVFSFGKDADHFSSKISLALLKTRS